MRYKVVTGIMLTPLLTTMLILMFSIQSAKGWTGTVYIREDGSIDPSDAPVMTYDNITYTLTDNITSSGDGIVAERDNIIIDGAGYTVQGTEAYESKGVNLMGISITLKNMEIKTFFYGIYLYSSNNIIMGNGITNNFYGIYLYSSNNIIMGNNITNNDWGIWVFLSNNNTIMGNNVLENKLFGISFDRTSDNSISGNNITAQYDYGISIVRSSYNSIMGNDITNNDWGIHLGESPNNTIMGNDITNNDWGIWLYYSSNNNTIMGNDITNNGIGIRLEDSSTDNRIYHNNFTDNIRLHVYSEGLVNLWDDGYPSGGNYWSNYTGTDAYNGPYQNLIGSDGIGDTANVIDANNIDRYPLMNPWSPTQTSVTVGGTSYPVVIVSNTTISQITTTANTLEFKSSGPTGEKGYINVIFPMVNTTAIQVYMDDNKLTPPPFPVINTNGTHYFIYFEFTLSTHNITIQFAPTPAVGGIYIPVNKLELLAPYIALASTILVATAIYIKHAKRRKKKQ